MSNTLLKYDYAELRIRCRANSETDEGECSTLRMLEKAANQSLLLKEKPFGGRSIQLLRAVTHDLYVQQMPLRHADAIGADVRSTAIGEKGRNARMELAPGRAVQVFPCRRGMTRDTPNLTQ